MEENIIEQPVPETEEIYSENQEGSMLGKFKDAKTLLDAYNSLQSELTRNCQNLAEFQKENEETALFNKYDSIDDFINSTNGSDIYKEEMLEILKNEEINNLPNKYLIAFKIAENTSRKTAKLLNDQNFIDKEILNNQDIKEKIISNYLSDLNNISQAPNIISGNATSVYFSPETSRPTTIKEASEIFSKMLK